MRHGQPHGNGKATYTSSIDDSEDRQPKVYIGEFKSGVKHGRGKLSYANKDMYEGAWQDNKRHGEGTTTFADGDKYEGAWQDDKRHGEGTMAFADFGEYVAGRRTACLTARAG